MENELIIPTTERDFYLRLGAALRAARAARDISIDTLAAAAGISTETLVQYEDAKIAIPVYHLIPIMQFMEYPPELESAAICAK